MPRAATRIVTPKRPVDIAKVFPALARLARPAIRLHPVRGNVTAESSHLGGSILWPKDEPWPTTTAKQAPLLERDETRMCLKSVRRPNRTLVPILQLRREDVPSFEFPDGTDLFQLLWNPRSHPAHGDGPFVQVRWRTVATIGALLGEAPEAELPDPALIPQPCSLSPEEIVEYPCPLDLPRALRREIDAWDRARRGSGDDDDDGDQALYQYHLGAAPGMKLGGHPYFNKSDPVQPRCARKHPMQLLVTIDGCEWDGTEGWRPVRGRRPLTDAEPTGLRVGRDGSLFVFVCRRCDAWPIATVMQ